MAFPIGAIVQLEREWTIQGFIGRGGLGAVFSTISNDGELYALKLIPKVPGANRELLFGDDLRGSVNVMPTVDSGEWRDYLVLVMPRARMSLRQLLDQVGKVEPSDALDVLIDVSEALVSLESRVVHRDIKPDNILLIGSRWNLADFGISKYAEATTADDTRKFARTAKYAAPEQWRFETATSATDVYALGVVAYEILAGHPPFDSDDESELRRQHLEGRPPKLPNTQVPLHSVIAECLIKAPGGRPSPQRLLAQLRSAHELPSPGSTVNLLQQANLVAVERKAERERAKSIQQSEYHRRDQLYRAARDSFGEMMTLVSASIRNAVPQVIEEYLGRDHTWRLNEATLVIQSPFMTEEPDSADRFSMPPFDIIAHGAVGIRIPRDRLDYEGRSHSLWYCDAKTKGEYRWFETAFMRSPLTAQQTTVRPYGMDPSPEAYRALAPIMDVIQCACPFTEIDGEKAHAFADQWLRWFGLAATGRLQSPSTMPEREPHDSWRRGD